MAYLPIAWIGDLIFSVGQSFVAGFTPNCPESTATLKTDMREIGPTYLLFPPRIWENILTEVMIKIEEADFIKEQALEETLELHCVRGSEYFELLKVYGEEGICSGLHRVLEVARHEGKYLKDFFEASRAQNENAFDPSSLVSNLKRVNAEDELKGWMRFQKEEMLRLFSV